MGVLRSAKYGYLMGHELKVLNGGWKVYKRSARSDIIRDVGSLGTSDLTCITCWSSAWGGGNSARPMDLTAKCGLQLRVVKCLNKSNWKGLRDLIG
jgi:hypothetical protein